MSPKAGSADGAGKRRYYTRKRDVKLKAGEVVGFSEGRGYYAKLPRSTAAAKPKPAPKKPAAKKPDVHAPTSPAPNPKHGKRRPAARAASHVGLVVAKLRHAVAPGPEAKRALVVAFCRWGIAHASEIHYAQTRPIPQVIPGKLPRLPFTTDCSGFATMAYQYAGLPDPNGEHYNGQGWTGTLGSHGAPTSAPRRADIGVYGSPPGHHAVVALNKGATRLGSHGSDRGPLDIAAAVEDSYQGASAQFYALTD